MRLPYPKSTTDICYSPPMTIEESPLPGLFLLRPKVIEDARGFFSEVFRLDEMAMCGIHPTFVQMNHSSSKPGILRGLHFQWDPPLGKFIRVLSGTAFMAAVDIRKKSPTLGQWFGVEVSRANRLSLFAPPGFATGFCVVGDEDAEVEYCYTALYNQKGEGVIRWNDPAIGIEWPVENPSVSERDAKAGTFAEWMAKEESSRF